MDFAADFTRRVKVWYTSLGQQHQAVWRIGDTINQADIAFDLGSVFKNTIHNTDNVIRFEYAAKGSNVFLPLTVDPGPIGPGGRSGTAPTAIGLHMATQRTISGRTVAGNRWKFVWFNALDAEYDDFKQNPDELDTADITFINAMVAMGVAGDLVGNDGQSVAQIYPRITTAVNDHYVRLYRRTRAG